MGYFVIVKKDSRINQSKLSQQKNSVFETELLVAKIIFQSHSIFFFCFGGLWLVDIAVLSQSQFLVKRLMEATRTKLSAKCSGLM